VLREVIGAVGGMLMKSSKDAVVRVLAENLSARESKQVRVQTVLLICSIAKDLPSSQYKAVQTSGCVTGMLQTVSELVAAGDEEAVQECLEAMTEVASDEPMFFKGVVADLAKLSCSIAGDMKQLENDTRAIAIELIVSLIEIKGKMCLKAQPDLPKQVVVTCLKQMLELDDGNVANWMRRFSDHEDEEEEEEMYDCGLMSLDRVAKALGASTVLPVVFAVVGEFVKQSAWQYKVAGLMAVSQVAEIIEDNAHTDEIMKLLLSHANNEHPRVRYAALHAIGQVATDCAPHVEEVWHEQVIPVLFQAMDDQVPRVGSHACSAFVNFCEECDADSILPHMDSLMTKLFGKIQKNQPRQVRQEGVTAIAVLAAVVENHFAKYYGYIMPVLKEIVATATSQDERMLRGKAFECLSLLGIAVGKEMFRVDARDAMHAVLHIQQTSAAKPSAAGGDDKEGTFKEFVYESCQMVSSVLKEEFAEYLGGLLPGLLGSIGAAAKAYELGEEEEEDTVAIVDDADGKYKGIKTSQLRELLSTVQTLQAFITNVGKAYVPFVAQTALTVLPLLDFEFDEEIKSEAVSCWAAMISIADANTGRELLMQVIQKLSKSMEEEQYDLYALETQARGLSECLKAAPAELLMATEVQSVLKLVMTLLEESLKRRAENEEEKKAQAGEQEEDDAEDMEAEEEQNENVRIALMEILGSLMNKSKTAFIQAGGFNITSSIMQKFLSTPNAPAADRSLALYVACDLLEYLGAESVSVWPVFIDHMLQAVNDPDAQLRQAACFGVNVAARIADFARFSQTAAQRLAQVVRSPNARTKKNLLATENAAAALGWLVEKQPAALGGSAGEVANVWLESLPLVEDEDEGQSTHSQLLRLVKAGGFQGEEQKARLIKIFAQIFKKDNCDEATNLGILELFKSLGREGVAKLLATSKVTNKEKNQINRIFELIHM
jgi:hypothetical protein